MFGIRVYMPHQNLGCLGVSMYGKYADLSLPHREHFGWNWGGVLRLYWRWNGKRRFLYLPSFRFMTSR